MTSTPDGSVRSLRFWTLVQRVCLALIVVSFGWLVVTAWQPIRLNWGDPWSDIDIMTAGRFFANEGFLATSFTPVIDVMPLDELSYRYTHYPPLAEILNGSVQWVTGSDSLAMFRLIFVGFSALGVLFFFRFARRVWGERVAWIASALFATNSLWLKYADCIHSHPLHLMTGFGALWWLTRWIDTGRKRDAGIFAGWCVAAFMSSYDYYLFLPIMIVATPRLLGHPLRGGLTLRATLLGALGCSLGLALKCGLVIGALGWDGFIADLEFQYLERATTKYSYNITREFWKILFFRHYRFFSPTFYLVVLLGIGALFHRRLRPFAGTPSPWVLFGAGLCFIFAMKQLFCEQYHVSLSLLPYFAIAGALIATRAFESRLGLPLALAGLLFTYGWHVREVVTFRYAFLEPAQLAPVRAELDANDRNGFVYSTMSFTPSFRYSLNRHMISTFYMAPEKLAAFFEQQTRIFGGRAPYVVHHEPFLEAYEDTKVLAFFAGRLGQRRWLRDPWRSRPAREAIYRRRLEGQLAVIASVSDRIMEAGAFTVYRVNPDKLRAVLHPAPGAVPARIAADAAAFARAIDESVGEAVKTPRGTVRHTLHHRPRRLVLGTFGVKTTAPPEPVLDFTLRLPQDGSREQRVRLELRSLVPHQTLRVQGTSVTMAQPDEDHTVEFTMPRRGDRPMIEEVPIRFELDRVDASGHGVALEAIEIVQAGP